jgi:hypothetical protein
MLKRGLIVSGILLLSLLLLGCGVPQADYDAMEAERDAALAELQSAQSQLNSAQAEVSNLSSELAEKEGRLSDIEQILGPLGTKMEIAALLCDYNQMEWKAAAHDISSDELVEWAMTEFKENMTVYVTEVGDSHLTDLWNSAFIWLSPLQVYSIMLQGYDDLYNYVGELLIDDFTALWTVLLAD